MPSLKLYITDGPKNVARNTTKVVKFSECWIIIEFMFHLGSSSLNLSVYCYVTYFFELIALILPLEFSRPFNIFRIRACLHDPA